MKTIYFDCFSGISGDMILGALIDAGVKQEDFQQELGKLNVEGYELKIETQSCNGITATDVAVILKHDHQHGRNLSDIKNIINSSKLSEWVKQKSMKTFEILAEAEAAVHNTEIQNIHFHEVGAIDAIIDIVGSFICLEKLEIEKVLCSPLIDGKGFITCHHGTLPVPVPAVMEIAKRKSVPIIQTDVDTELVTPTGISIITAISDGFGVMPMMVINGLGYGLGKRKTTRPNMLRVVIGELLENLKEEIYLLQANIDDMSPEVLGFVMEELMDQGALDVYFTPIFMKKNRPGTLLNVLCDRKDKQKISDYILRETTTIGLRFIKCEREKLERKSISVTTKYGEIGIKVSRRDNIVKVKAEYEDCKKVSLERKVPIIEVMKEAEIKAKENIE